MKSGLVFGLWRVSSYSQPLLQTQRHRSTAHGRHPLSTFQRANLPAEALWTHRLRRPRPKDSRRVGWDGTWDRRFSVPRVTLAPWARGPRFEQRCSDSPAMLHLDDACTWIGLLPGSTSFSLVTSQSPSLRCITAVSSDTTHSPSPAWILKLAPCSLDLIPLGSLKHNSLPPHE